MPARYTWSWNSVPGNDPRNPVDPLISGIEYSTCGMVSVDECILVRDRPGLAARRPVPVCVCIEGTLQYLDLLATARLDGLLVGLSRSVKDFPKPGFCRYPQAVHSGKRSHPAGVGSLDTRWRFVLRLVSGTF